MLDDVGIQQLLDAILAEQLGQQRGIEREGRRLLLCERHVTLVDECTDVAEEQERANGDGSFVSTSTIRSDRDATCRCTSSRPSRSKTSFRHSRIVSSTMGNSG